MILGVKAKIIGCIAFWRNAFPAETRTNVVTAFMAISVDFEKQGQKKQVDITDGLKYNFTR